MNKTEFLNICLKNKNFNVLQFLYDILALHDVGYKSEFKSVSIDGVLYFVEGKELSIDGSDISKPLFTSLDEVTVYADSMTCLDKDIKTTFGRVLANYALVEVPFKGKISFYNKPFTVKTIENDHLGIRLDNKKPDTILIPEYIQFTKGSDFLKGLSNIIVFAATERAITPPPGIKKKKKEYMDAIIKREGPDAFKDFKNIVELEGKLMKDLEDHMKDDPSYGVTVAGKVKNIAMKNMYLVGGGEVGFNPNADATFIAESLEEGTPMTKEAITAANNKARYGSYARGNETKFAGLMAKLILRAIFSIKILDKDCKTTNTKKVLLTKGNGDGYIGRYILKAGKNVLLERENIKDYFNATINLRSPGYCKIPDNHSCKICAGKAVSDSSDSFTLSVIEVTDILLNAVMKSMHGKVLSTIELDLSDGLS